MHTSLKNLRLKKFRWILVLLIAFALLAGSSCREQRKLEPTGKTRPAVHLQLVVLGDPELAHAIGLLKSEWNARTGSTFEVSSAPDGPLGGGSSEDGPADEELTPKLDAIICRAARLGGLVSSDRIRPLPKEVLAGDELAWSDVYPLIQQGEASYGGQVYAVPFGAPVLTLCYRVDLFEKFDRKPPKTWQEYQTECEFFADRERLAEVLPDKASPWHAALEPLSHGWAGQMLLARAAAYARHRDNYSTLFNIEDFQPLVDQPPFVRALKELVAAVKTSNTTADVAEIWRLDPEGVRASLFAGGCAMAITWPTAAGHSRETAPLAGQIAFAELPGSPDSFNFARGAWDVRTADEPIHVPLVPISGRLGVVSKDSTHPTEAVRLLSWLSGTTWGTQVASGSSATTLYRRSQAAVPQEWVEPGVGSASAKQYAEVTGQSLTRPVWMHALRIPDEWKYMCLLDSSVSDAITGEKSPDKALGEAAESWSATSRDSGAHEQLRAYRQSLGLD